MTGMRAKLVARIAALGAATMGLSACYYDAGVGLGYYDDGYSYYDDGYGCDPYSPFDRYYDCDYRGGFYNIGYGGGWYQDYWYPGYGFYIFDRGGKRYKMYDHHRRYWGGKRHEWYREHHGRQGGHDGRRGDGNRRHYGDGSNGNGRWSGQDGLGVHPGRPTSRYRDSNAVGNGQPDIWQRDRRRDDRRGDGRGDRRRDWQRNGQGAVVQPSQDATPPVAPPARGDRGSWRRGGDGERRNWQAPAAPQVPQGTAAPAPSSVAKPRSARPSRDLQREPRNTEFPRARSD